MTTPSIWDDPDLAMNDDFVKLETVGDEVRGLIRSIRPHRFDDGSVAVQILFRDDRDGAERTWSAGQVMAKKRLAELRPESGWHFTARLTDIERRSGGKTLKHISIDATPPAGAPPVAAPATGGAGGRLACPPGADPGRWAAMNDQQRQQMYDALGLNRGDVGGEPPF